ncbi:MAG: hypothetical protein IPI60_02890 [Saprospiraceae bacterium]|nr:hypothetical protein [Saprospiraceae bacterium]
MLRTKYNFFFLLVAVFLMQSFHPGVQEIKHPFYASVSEIRIDDQKKQLTLSCKLFTDDLQDALYKQFKWKADLKNESPEQDSLLKLYIKERVGIQYADADIKLNWVGYEIEKEAVWSYLEGTFSQSGRSIQMNNELLYDYLPKQSNIIHCYLNKKRKSYKLQQPESIAKFEF